MVSSQRKWFVAYAGLVASNEWAAGDGISSIIGSVHARSALDRLASQLVPFGVDDWTRREESFYSETTEECVRGSLDIHRRT